MPANFQEKTARTWALFCFNFAPKFCDNLLAEKSDKIATRSVTVCSFSFAQMFVFFGLSPFSLVSSGTFTICRLPLSRPMKSSYKEHSRKGPRYNQDLSRTKWGTLKKQLLFQSRLSFKKSGTIQALSNPKNLLRFIFNLERLVLLFWGYFRVAPVLFVYGSGFRFRWFLWVKTFFLCFSAD